MKEQDTANLAELLMQSENLAASVIMLKQFAAQQAEKEAVEFGEWIAENEYQGNIAHLNKEKYFVCDEGNDTPVTIQQLYQIKKKEDEQRTD